MSKYPTPEEWQAFYDWQTQYEDSLPCEDEFPEASGIDEDDQEE